MCTVKTFVDFLNLKDRRRQEHPEREWESQTGNEFLSADSPNAPDSDASDRRKLAARMEIQVYHQQGTRSAAGLSPRLFHPGRRCLKWHANCCTWSLSLCVFLQLKSFLTFSEVIFIISGILNSVANTFTSNIKKLYIYILKWIHLSK